MTEIFHITKKWFFQNYIIFSLFLSVFAFLGYLVFLYQQITQRGFLSTLVLILD
ncbi:MAG: hypothetical protein KatS3mg046_714 [Bellilinea sp.]|nr:MAG: hypothetical protein KatS3mg046_714 [Bellilinea sp.]